MVHLMCTDAVYDVMDISIVTVYCRELTLYKIPFTVSIPGKYILGYTQDIKHLRGTFV